MGQNEVSKIIEMLEDLNKRISKIEGNLVQKKESPKEESEKKEKLREESFMEFFNKYNPKKETDKALVIMHFLESRQKIDNMTSKEISNGFKEVREKIPTNVSDKIQMLHKRGLIMPEGSLGRSKSWLITRTGLEYLEGLKSGRKEKHN